MDDSLLKPIYDFIAKPCKHTTFNDLINDCLNRWIHDCNNDYEYAHSFDAFKESCECNDYDFLINGEFYD